MNGIRSQSKTVLTPGLKGSPLMNRGLNGKALQSSKKVRRISFIQNKGTPNVTIADNSVH